MKIGILGAADIAYRRFLPALEKCPEIVYVGVASRTLEKTLRFAERFGGKVYGSYGELLADKSVDAVYVPLPPALHYEWGKKVLLAGKHLFMEKPFTTAPGDTRELLELAAERRLITHENYMFLYHRQLTKVKELIADGMLGKIRLYRMAFGFPKRAEGDFRYCKTLGGGALLDCGGYPVRLALDLLGESARVVQAKLVQLEGYEVDLYGSAVLENDAGQTAQISFGMDNSYKCELEVWGSRGCLQAGRIFTAPSDFEPVITVKTQAGEETASVQADDAFLNSLHQFYGMTKDVCAWTEARRRIALHSELIQAVWKEGMRK